MNKLNLSILVYQQLARNSSNILNAKQILSPIRCLNTKFKNLFSKHNFQLVKKSWIIIRSFFTSTQNSKKEEIKNEDTSIKKDVTEFNRTPAKELVKKEETKSSAQKRQRKSSESSSPSSSSSKNKKEIKKSQKKLIKDDEEDDDILIDDKENNVKNKNKALNKVKETSPKLQMTKSDSENEVVEDSPIKRKSPQSEKKDSKRRKLRIESSSEEEEEVKTVKTNTKVSSEEKKKQTGGPKKTSPKKLNSPKATESVSIKKISPKKQQVEVKIELEEQSKEIKKEEVKEEKPNKPKADLANFFSKSTSNFANGKKNESGTTLGVKTQESSNSQEEYSPNKENYHPIDDASWPKDQPVPYKALAQTLYCMEKTTKRLELLSIVSNYFRSVIALSPKDLVSSIYILTNKVAPDYDSLELGIGDTVLFKALGEATGCTVAKLKTEFQSKGDIGLVAEANRCTQKLIFKPKKLTVNAVFTKFKEIASISGNASQSKKCDLIKGLLVSCDSIEARYLMRSLAGKLRNGLGEQSILQALGHACATTPPMLNSNDEQIIDAFKKIRLKDPEEMKARLEEAVQHVKHAYHQCPNYERVVSAILQHGIDKLEEHCKLTPGVPLKPMLAYPTKGLQEILKRFDNIEFTCEYKYDGERAQIHILEDGSINIYSRNSENNTSKYPDIIDFLKDILKLNKKDEEVANRVRSAIIDAEVVAYDTETKVIKPFQVLTTRKRKDVNAAEITVQVCIFAFDLLYLNGQSMIDKSFRKRRETMYEFFPEVESKLMHAVKMDSSNLESIQEFLDHSIRDGCEGLMVKTLDVEAHYEISKRSHNWLKLKKDYLDGVGDTLDCVVIGGYLGTGKRTGVYGGYLLAVYNPEEEEYQTICKLGTGLKDDDLQTQFESLSKIKIDKPKSYYRVNDTLEQPDHWFEPEQVWEIKCADFSISPVHTAAIGMVESAKGISMRFPRYIRLRDDKKAEDATSAEQLAEMYKNQQQMINQNQQKSSKSDNEEDDDMY